MLFIAAAIFVVARVIPSKRREETRQLRAQAHAHVATLMAIETHAKQAIDADPSDVLAQQIQYELQGLKRELGGSE